MNRWLESWHRDLIDCDFNHLDRLDMVSWLIFVRLGAIGRSFKLCVGSKEIEVFAELRQGPGCSHCEDRTECSSSDSDVSESDTDGNSCDVLHG